MWRPCGSGPEGDAPVERSRAARRPELKGVALILGVPIIQFGGLTGDAQLYIAGSSQFFPSTLGPDWIRAFSTSFPSVGFVAVGGPARKLPRLPRRRRDRRRGRLRPRRRHPSQAW